VAPSAQPSRGGTWHHLPVSGFRSPSAAHGPSRGATTQCHLVAATAGMLPAPVHHAGHGNISAAVPMPDGSARPGPAEAFATPDPLPDEDMLHVVFGAGQVGRVLAAVLAGRGLSVRVLSRHRPPELADGIDWRAADATDLDAVSDAAKGAAVVYQCLNAPYAQWPELFPPLQRGVLAAAEASGALLVVLENLYGYGPTGGKPMTEDLPLAATTVKGTTRAAMTAELLAAAEAGRLRIAIGRASDFFGAGVTEGSTLGERVFGNALAGRRADFIGKPDLPHTYSYVPDIAAGLATLGTDARAAGQVWHLPGPPTGTTRALLGLVAADVGHPVGIRSVPKLAVRALGLVNPMLRGLAELSYQFDEPFILDTRKYESVFGTAGTPLGEAVAATVAWYRTRPDTP
jgi:nucleoside-diphosphate-sugar epimerase